ncbi:M10 family metallopeptidase C-terminal domain-containing protein [Phenylobacterium sp. LjRoot219]|uniref:M10 family metallopeptidase C-terminal domain-containing protein n=1 Tax=Phenylobacterium sp. LjRoot219 TaxID=3342283 RepID=UPI003ECD9788
MSLEAASARPLDTTSSYLNADGRAGIAGNGKLSLTIEEAASQLLRGEPGWSSALGQPFNVTYAYRSTTPLEMPSDTAGFQRFSAAQIQATELALKAWSDVANITFTRVGFGSAGSAAYSNNATILLGNYTGGQAGSSAFSYFPGSIAGSSSSGDVWVNSTYGYNANPVMGGYGFMVLVHEIGHAIGLEHPSDYNAADGVTLSYAQNAGYYQDDLQYTVMSYFVESNTGADFGPDYPAAPMLDDIAAAQMAYGANMGTRTGDTVYGFNSNADAPWFAASTAISRLVFAVWDAGGVDTFDFSGYANNQLIDLREGYFSNVGGLIGNIAVAQGVIIEKAIGGSGADVIQGNAAGNSIDGGAGNDTIDGADGFNRLFGGDGADFIAGGAQFDAVNGNKGADTIDGGAGGDDWLLGGQGEDVITAHAGFTILNGNLGRDTVTGGGGADAVRGGQGDDVLNAGAGADQLFGDLGNDTMTGGEGADVFRVAPGGGVDLILDFQVGEDVLRLDGIGGYALTQSGADAVIGLGADQVILANVQVSSVAGSILLA